MQKLPAPASARRPPRRKLRPLDMTPMAGVGFLLVCFFLMASSFSRPTVMQLSMPVKPPPDALFEQSDCGCGTSVLTVLLGPNHQVWYYWGMLSNADLPGLHQTDLSPSGLRQVLLGFRAEGGPCGMVLLKPTDAANYRSLVDALDEMKVTDQRRYALVEVSEAEKALLCPRPR
ncbi:ExbD/TolR family protein [Hymenobacter rubripertinctus]|uniref:Biopolymer transporter ExbD n=1 Tax=Hymenobacter rubripertinctus TaxID=2029981 RepID=A0A418R660_9BACT|nr:biopolymer transporter ExbD [Hymenobacter rubripertinctus]RIY12943.1 biopolymer transporter ExbD [Hymenobacter rubripertinctus]